MEALAWIDIETTGLVPAQGRILEVGIIITDMNLKELSRFATLGCIGDVSVESTKAYCDEIVQEMHTNNGLWEDLQAEWEILPKWEFELDTIIAEGLKFVKSNFEIEKLYPAGSSVHFDMNWFDMYLEKSKALLHYRQLDVTSLKLVELIKTGTYKSDGDTAHRALADAEQSLNWLRDYLKHPVETLATEVEDEATRLLHQMKLDNV